ncbi:MAG: hypothetical protein FWC25_01845 [Dehalococcoidia bacterium]|nr:hypothetical protein [Dehalococcoidia bacterium]
MRKLSSVLLKPLVISIVACIALSTVIPISAEGLNDSARASRIHSPFVIYNPSGEPISEYIYEMEKAWNETYAGKPISDAEWKLMQQLSSWTPSGMVLTPDPVVGPTRAASVYMGTNIAFTTADHAQSGHSGSSLGAYTHSTNLSTRSHYAKVTLALSGTAEAGSTTGQTFTVYGTGSRNADISLYGKATADLSAPGYGNACWEVKMEIWDLTGSSTLIKTEPIFSHVTFFGSAWNNAGGSIVSRATVNLQAGHTYIVRMFTTTEVNVGISSMNHVSDSSTSSRYSTWDQIDIFWK